MKPIDSVVGNRGRRPLGCEPPFLPCYARAVILEVALWEVLAVVAPVVCALWVVGWGGEKLAKRARAEWPEVREALRDLRR